MIFFDIDNTLFDYKSSEATAAKEFAKQIPEFKNNPNAFAQSWRLVTERHMARYLSGTISFQEQRRERVREVISEQIDEQEADRLFEIYHEVFMGSWQLFPETVAALELLKEHRIGVITNGDPVQQDMKLKKLGVREIFEMLVTPREAGSAKPSTKIYKHAATLARVAPEHCWHIGDDYETDYRAAQDAKFQAALIDRHDQKYEGNHIYPDLLSACRKVSILA